MNDEANLSIIVALARWLALIGVLVWALTSKGGDGGRQGHRNVADDERRFEQQEQRWLHRGSARRPERKLRRRFLRFDGLLIRVERGVGRLDAADRVRPVDCVTGIIPDDACRLRYDARSI